MRKLRCREKRCRISKVKKGGRGPRVVEIGGRIECCEGGEFDVGPQSARQ